MIYVAHRINKVEELKKVPSEYGVEIDLRDWQDRLILQHDPFKGGQDFEEYLQHYHHALMVLNIKSERIEHEVLRLLKKYKITDYFFLDSSFPMIYLLSRQGESNSALRFSEFEGMDTILAMKGRVKWVWVDCFSKLPLDGKKYGILKQAGFKLCLVSPELQKHEHDIEVYRNFLINEGIVFDAVCTKMRNIGKWQTLKNEKIQQKK